VERVPVTMAESSCAQIVCALAAATGQIQHEGNTLSSPQPRGSVLHKFTSYRYWCGYTYSMVAGWFIRGTSGWIQRSNLQVRLCTYHSSATQQLLVCFCSQKVWLFHFVSLIESLLLLLCVCGLVPLLCAEWWWKRDRESGRVSSRALVTTLPPSDRPDTHSRQGTVRTSLTAIFFSVLAFERG